MRTLGFVGRRFVRVSPGNTIVVGTATVPLVVVTFDGSGNFGPTLPPCVRRRSSGRRASHSRRRPSWVRLGPLRAYSLYYLLHDKLSHKIVDCVLAIPFLPQTIPNLC